MQPKSLVSAEVKKLLTFPDGVVIIETCAFSAWVGGDTNGVNNQPVALSDTDGVNNIFVTF